MHSKPYTIATYVLDDTIEFQMVYVEGGRFCTKENESGYQNEKLVQELDLTSFWLGQTQVTQELWEAVMRGNPSNFKSAKRPVDTVSWYDCIKFCNILSRKNGLESVYTIDTSQKNPNNQFEDQIFPVSINSSANGFRLPTEAEWAYAARGGRYSLGFIYAGGEDPDRLVWHHKTTYAKTTNSEHYFSSVVGTQRVAQKLPNELGLFDMSGNIWEWCWDKYDTYMQESTSTEWPYENRVLRGGSWLRHPLHCLVDYRFHNWPHYRTDVYGLRLARTTFG